jgi:hypothetical protein
LAGRRYWPIPESPQHLLPRRPVSTREMGNWGDLAHWHILEDRNDLKIEFVSGAPGVCDRDYAMQCKARHEGCSLRARLLDLPGNTNGRDAPPAGDVIVVDAMGDQVLDATSRFRPAGSTVIC